MEAQEVRPIIATPKCITPRTGAPFTPFTLILLPQGSVFDIEDTAWMDSKFMYSRDEERHL
jgi:hypothetical protein